MVVAFFSTFAQNFPTPYESNLSQTSIPNLRDSRRIFEHLPHSKLIKACSLTTIVLHSFPEQTSEAHRYTEVTVISEKQFLCGRDIFKGTVAPSHSVRVQ